MAAQTITEMQKLSTEKLLAGVVDEIINADPIFARVPFETFQGTQKTWVREATRPVPQFYDVDAQLSTGVGTKTQVTLSTVMIGHDAETPGYSRTLEDINGQRAINVRDTLLGMADVIGDKMIYGNSASNALEFNGLHALLPAAQELSETSSDTPSALNLSNLDIQFDLVKKGSVDVISVTRNIRRRFSAFVNFSSTNTSIRTDKDEFGTQIFRYNETPIVHNDRQTQTELTSSDVFSAKTGGTGSSLFLVQFGMPNTEKPGIFGIQGPNGLEQIPLGWDQQHKDNWIDRLVWYLGLGLGSTKTNAAIVGIADAAVVA